MLAVESLSADSEARSNPSQGAHSTSFKKRDAGDDTNLHVEEQPADPPSSQSSSGGSLPASSTQNEEKRAIPDATPARRAGEIPELPQLPYSLRNHKLSIAIIWTFLALDSAILPLLLYYVLRYCTTLNVAYVFAVTTSVFGIVSGMEWLFRTWHLYKKKAVRPLDLYDEHSADAAEAGEGIVVEDETKAAKEESIATNGESDKAGKWEFDFFHRTYTTGYTVALIELIIGAAPHKPIIRLCALPSPSFILIFGVVLLAFSIGDHFHRRNTHFRVSSLTKNSHYRPATYFILEDVISVDTGVGKLYRRRVAQRWDASPPFRSLLRGMAWFWGIPAFTIGVACFVVIFLEDVVSEDVAYGVGWGVPPVWALLWTLITFPTVQYCLRREKRIWAAKFRQSSHDLALKEEVDDKSAATRPDRMAQV